MGCRRLGWGVPPVCVARSLKLNIQIFIYCSIHAFFSSSLRQNSLTSFLIYFSSNYILVSCLHHLGNFEYTNKVSLLSFLFHKPHDMLCNMLSSMVDKVGLPNFVELACIFQVLVELVGNSLLGNSIFHLVIHSH